jgi:preprotein translocase subunit SecE
LVEQQTPNLSVGGSSPSWPAIKKKKKKMIKNVTQFVKEVHLELSKVTWPKFDEFIGSTIVVLVLVTFFSVYLGLIDLGLSELMRRVFKLYSGY